MNIDQINPDLMTFSELTNLEKTVPEERNKRLAEFMACPELLEKSIRDWSDETFEKVSGDFSRPPARGPSGQGDRLMPQPGLRKFPFRLSGTYGEAPGMSPTGRTLNHFRKLGYDVAVAERWIPQAGVRKDLFGFLDLVAIKAGEPILGLQVTTTAHVANRLAKARALPSLRTWLAAGGRFLVIGWIKRKGQWHRREIEVKGKDLAGVEVQALPRPRRPRRGERQRLLFQE